MQRFGVGAALAATGSIAADTQSAIRIAKLGRTAYDIGASMLNGGLAVPHYCNAMTLADIVFLGELCTLTDKGDSVFPVFNATDAGVQIIDAIRDGK